MIFLDHRLWHPDMHGDRDPDDPSQLPDGGEGGGAGGHDDDDDEDGDKSSDRDYVDDQPRR